MILEAIAILKTLKIIYCTVLYGKMYGTFENIALLLDVTMKVTIAEVEATYDLNLHQLQYVSDHISETECRKLSEALSMEGVLLRHPVSGVNEKDLSCIRLLLLWDRSDRGRGNSFNDISIKLRQIGRADVANELSKMVHGEKANQVQSATRTAPRSCAQ